MARFEFHHPYAIDKRYQKKVAYFCMEFAIHQSLKIYAGGLGFLAGSHIRSAYALHQNMVGIGILWKYGYYDQIRKSDQGMDVLFQEKVYGFLVDTGIRFTITVSGHPVWVAAYYLPPDVFQTCPLFLLSTDLPENDYLAKTICHKLYDSNPETKIAAAILLGAGGAHLLEQLEWEPDVYHLNESHGLPLAFYLYNRYKKANEVKKRLIFTNHTPEKAGNPETEITLLNKMGFFCDVPLTEANVIAQLNDHVLDHSLTALRMAGKANGVSALHHKTLCAMWSQYESICPINYITNAQNYAFWGDHLMYQALKKEDDKELWRRKKHCKQKLFEEVADQNGEIYDSDILTIVFAKRFTGYKRADLLLHDMDRFHRLVSNANRPVQIIWAGKPYPADYTGIGTFDKIVDVCKKYNNCASLVGYELSLSKLLKGGADVWLNIPRLTHEASGTSGMAAAMNGAVNVALPDGWFPEFARNRKNSFVIPACDTSLPDHLQDDADANQLYELLEKEVIPMYYDYPDSWLDIVKNGMRDVIPAFDSDRLAREYYEQMYNPLSTLNTK